MAETNSDPSGDECGDPRLARATRSTQPILGISRVRLGFMYTLGRRRCDYDDEGQNKATEEGGEEGGEEEEVTAYSPTVPTEKNAFAGSLDTCSKK